jgi:DNA modification methylase
MLFKYKTQDGKKRALQKPLLIDPADGYVRPAEGKVWFETTTSIWHVDELIKRRVKDWRQLTGEDGHSGERNEIMRPDHDSVFTGTYSVFPIPLMEWILLRYGGPAGGKVLDAFAGGPPRAVASSIMGYTYHGYDIRQSQIDEDEAVIKRLKLKNVHYHLGDARELGEESDFDVAVTCPPYYDLEVYSDGPDDISNFRTYEEFNAAMWLSAEAHFPRLKPGAFVCIIVGNMRDKRGELIDFRAHTVENFREAGFLFWQDIILSKNFGSAAKRSTNAWKGLKLVARHEHLLVFRKPKDDNKGRASRDKGA